MKKSVLIGCVLTATGMLQAQAQSFQWAKGLGGTAGDYGYQIATDGSGNIYVLGSFEGTADFDPSAATVTLTSLGSYDVFLAKYDANGNYLWAHNIGASEGDFGNGLAVNNSGEAFITGSFRGTVDFDPGSGTANVTVSSGGGDDIFIACYDAGGNYVWAKGIGAGINDYSRAIALDGSGNLYITGEFAGTVDFDPSGASANLSATASYDVFVAKYNSVGNYVWARKASTTWNDFSYGITTDASANVYVTGSFNGTAYFGSQTITSPGADNVFLVKYNSAGTAQWARNIASSGNGTAEGRSVKTDLGGNIYITGSFVGSFDFNPGTGTAMLSCTIQQDIFMAKYDAGGNYLWAIQMGGSGQDMGTNLSLDARANVYVCGHFNGTADFDGSSGTANIASAGNADAYLVKYDSTGAFKWVKKTGSTGNDRALGLYVDAGTNIFITGFFEVTTDFDPSAATANLTAAGLTDGFVVKYCGTTPDQPAGITGSNSPCAGGSETYSVPNDTMATSYSWTLPAGWIGTSTTNSITVTAGTAGGNLSVSASNTCGTSEVRTLVVSVNTVNVSVTQSGLVLTAAATGASYQWLDCNDGMAPENGATLQSYTAGSGSYAVEVSSNGCTDTSSCFLVPATGTPEQTKGSFRIYPNPTRGNVSLLLEEEGDQIRVVLQDALGRELLTKQFNNTDYMDLDTDLAPGVYFVTVLRMGKSALVGKLVVEH